MLNEAQNMFPVIIPAVHPMRNVLSGFKNILGFNKIWRYLNKTTIHIIQIGAGGTGGYTAVDLMRFIGNLPKEIQKYIYYTIIDGDVFEEKNLGRQLCQEDDLGHNKAEVLVENYAVAFGCLSDHIVALPEYVNSVEQLTKLSFGCPKIRIYSKNLSNKSNYGTSLFNKCFCSYGSTPNKYDKNGYHTFYDKKNHASVNINYKSCFDENLALCNENGMFPGWESVNDSTNNDKEHIIPIFIDCVDNNTVRNIINATIEAIGSCFTDATEHVKNSIFTLLSNYLSYDMWLSSNFRSACKKDTLKNWKLFVDVMGHLLLSNENNELDYSVLNRVFDDDDNRLITYTKNSSLHSVYLVSSGNGKYAGQVAWGRYCLSPFRSIYNTLSIIRYQDIWKDQEHSGCYMSKDKNPTLEAEDIKLPPGILHLSYKRINLDYPGLKEVKYDTVNNAVTLNAPEFVFDNNTASYLYPADWKFYGIKIGTFSPNDPNTITNDIIYKLLLIDYNLQKINDTSYGIEAYKKMTDCGARITGIDCDINNNLNTNNHLDHIKLLLQEANVDSNYALPIFANQSSCFYRPFKSTDHKIIPFFERYLNFTDWVSQFISVPLPYQLYPTLLDVTEDEKEERMSCAERAEQNIQFINANKTAANLVVQYVTNIINGLFALETPGGEEYRMANVATEFDTYTDTVRNVQLTSSLLREFPIKCNQSSIEIATGSNARYVWHKYNG